MLRSSLFWRNTRPPRRITKIPHRGELVRWSSSRVTDGLRDRRANTWIFYSTAFVLLSGGVYVTYENYQPFRHSVLAVVRCSRVANAAIAGAIDYKRTLAGKYPSEEERYDAYSQCHLRSAQRVLKALLANGGVFIKLGQHMASMVLLPKEWTSTMRPLQDKCEPTPYTDLEALFLSDMGCSVGDLFDYLDPVPIGVASLAQVHIGHHRETGKQVAVKLQHPHLAEFCDIDMEMVEISLGWIKYWFPEFEFTWLAEEMRENLPKEMDFVHEARNAQRAEADFENICTSLYIPEVIVAKKRVLIMEYIKGGRIDDLAYLASHKIDRNTVALELSRIFNRMVFLNGWFHADPHPGNLLIRPAPPHSKSPYNFEIALLDHGLYFDLDTPLRINYAKLWISLMTSASPSTNADRKKYAELVGNITPDLYPIFEAAITGRAALEGAWGEDDIVDGKALRRASSMIDITPQTEKEMEAIRNAVIKREGLLLSVFDVLRRVPRRVLMVLKLNDLTRSLDHALVTTHSGIRIFLIMAKCCVLAVWENDRRMIRITSLGSLRDFFFAWCQFQTTYRKLIILETLLDLQGYLVQNLAWWRGLLNRGLEGAGEAAAGLA